MAAATSAMIRQSGRAWPGGANSGRWREIRRSELVTTPSFSPQARAGSFTWAKAMVSVSAMQSETMTKGQRARAAATRRESGRLTAGFVAMIQIALIRPSATASNISTAFRPGLRATRSEPQKRPTLATDSTSNPMCAARVEAMPPTSRPPMALGWPVIEKGQAPGLPMRPVIRWALITASPLATPCTDWLEPWENRLTVRGASANRWKKASSSASATPQSAATAPGDWSSAARAVARSGSPWVWAAMKPSSQRPCPSSQAQRPFHSRTSVWGARARCRSAISAVSVRRGSMTAQRWPRALACSMRRNSTGWVQAALWPANTTSWARSRSS